MQKIYFAMKCALVLLLLLACNIAFAQVQVTGTVSDDSGPVPGASVVIKGTTKGVKTDMNGRFSINAAKGDVLNFSFLGDLPKEVTVGDQNVINIKLAPNNKELGEVVVTSFGIKRQERALGYATSTVTSKQITEAGSTNFASALYGKVAGLKVVSAPGGASSAVNMQIRGVNSINFNQQPLIVVDGVILRNENQNGAAGVNNNGFWDDQRIRGNGVLDVNPEDIESITVLKGASATALYGSDATSGVIVITTKKGAKGKGPTVDVNYYGTLEQAAFLPKFQNVYGPGYDRATNAEVGANEDGWIPDPTSPTGYRPNFRAYANFGPKMDGQQVQWWDGSIRSYSPQPNNYKDIFRTGYSSLANVALSNQTDNYNYRISASRLDYGSIQRASDLQKNTFSLNSGLKLSKKLSVDLVANYVNTLTHNRPYQTYQLASSFDGFFGREEDMKLILQKYHTSQGYDWVPYDQTARNPSEAFMFKVRPNLYDYFWTTQKNTYDENENRLYSSATLNWDIVDHFKFRGRIGNDYTGRSFEEKDYSQYPSAFNPPNSSTGAYSVGTGIYSIVYGDALLTYANNIKDFGYSVSAGFTSRSERYKDEASSTNSGLVTENWFTLNNSYGILNTSFNRQYLLKYGYFGILDLSYKNYLFLEGTMRQESASTLPAQNNTYYYPSVNGSFVFSEALKDKMPSFWSYGKLRAAYGVVGNPAPIYTSNILYSQTSLQTGSGSVPQLTLPSTYGNSNLKPEMKHEGEIGLESRFFNDSFGIDVTYYNNHIKDIIMQLPIAPSNGAARQIINAGEIGNRGWEIALNGTPLNGDFKWQTNINFAFNRSKVYSLAPGVPQLVSYSTEQDAIRITAKAGEELGNIYVNPIATDSKGNRIVDQSGLYVIDYSRYVKAGNVLPKVTGGFSNTFSYKKFSLNVLIDYRLGGQIVSAPQKYATGAGMYESTLKYRDAAHGGLSYYVNGNGTYVATSGSAGPNGEKVYHDGMIIPGVQANGQPNTTIIQAATYYFNTFQWGQDADNQDGAIFNNSYVKMREVTLGYTLPKSVANAVHVSNLRFALIGRNLFYIYRTLKNLDPETMLGSQWWRQGVDEGSMPATRSFGFSLNATF
jgi:iron complex outermembrane receptor protein